MRVKRQNGSRWPQRHFVLTLARAERTSCRDSGYMCTALLMPLLGSAFGHGVLPNDYPTTLRLCCALEGRTFRVGRSQPALRTGSHWVPGRPGKITPRKYKVQSGQYFKKETFEKWTCSGMLPRCVAPRGYRGCTPTV